MSAHRIRFRRILFRQPHPPFALRLQDRCAKIPRQWRPEDIVFRRNLTIGFRKRGQSIRLWIMTGIVKLPRRTVSAFLRSLQRKG
ncbi:MAG TPA: hypothetical protein DCL55_16050 [Brevundimonas sp.]|nr:hypothetical protein [Brevundimonas sp.]